MTSLEDSDVEVINQAYNDFLTILLNKITEISELDTIYNLKSLNDHIMQTYLRLPTLRKNKDSKIDSVLNDKLKFLRSINYHRKLEIPYEIKAYVADKLTSELLTISEVDCPSEKLQILDKIYHTVSEVLKLSPNYIAELRKERMLHILSYIILLSDWVDIAMEIRYVIVSLYPYSPYC